MGLPQLPIVEWAIAFFRGMGDGRVFQPRTAMLKMILPLGFSLASIRVSSLLYVGAWPKHAK